MKKVLKKLPLLILALVLVLAIKDKTYAATYGKLTYEVKNDGTIEITDCDTSASGALTIPDTIDGKKVMSIGWAAFKDCRNLTSITIPNSVTSIGDEAFFECSSLTSINVSNNNKNYSSIDGVLFNKDKTQIISYSEGKKETSYIIPDSVTSIGNSAFIYCDSLTSITIPNSVTSIGGYAFYYCSSLTSITIPEGVKSIGMYAFKYCDSLTSITIPESVTSIEDSAFSSCSSLTNVTIPNSVTSIGDWAFEGCSSLTSVNVSDNNKYYCDVDGVLFNKDKTEIIKFPEKKEGTNYQIPESVTSIGSSAFSGCGNLTNITIPNSVTSIGSSAFSGCGSLTSITIPESVTSIGSSAFSGCGSLTSITIPNSVTSIGDYTFFFCSSLTNITIPNSVTSIGKYAFRACRSLTNITIPNSVTSIGSSAFQGCSSLTSITIPDGVTSIGSSAFSGCGGLTSITIPNSVTSIEDSAFAWCSSLTNITIPESVTSIGDSAFYYCDSLTSITIPESVTSIEDSAFYYCDSLTSITIPNSVTSIGDSAFEGCSSLTSITIPDGVTSIGSSAFSDCGSLISIAIPESVTSIGDSAFRYCYSLTSITIPDGVTSIGSNAFSGCDSLTSITIPKGITSIGNEAFKDCNSLTSINVSDNNKYYCDVDGVLFNKDKTEIIMFPEKKEGTNYQIPDSVTSIGSSAFFSCDNLTSITIPSSVTSIGSEAFYFCDSLSKVLCLGNSPKLGSESFYEPSSVLKLYAKNGLTGYDANGWENYSDKIVRYNEALKKNSVTFKSRKQTEKIEMVDDTVFKEIASIKSYEIEDKSIVSVDSSGKVTPLKNGKTNVKAVVQYFDGTEVNLTEEIVVDFKAESISLDKTNITLNNNKPVKLNEKVLPEETNNKKVTWSSSNEKVATVDENGNVTAVVSENPVGQGTCKITATTADGTNLSASCDVTVDIKAESIGFSLTSYTITNLGQTPSFKPKILPENTANKNVTWKSSDTSIATVSSIGVIKAVGSGTCRIIATTIDGSEITASCDVTVDIKTTGMKLDKTNYTFNKAETIKINPVITPSKASKKLTWTSSNTKVAIVSSDGKVTPVGKGTCKITATTTDGTNLSSSCNITSNVEYQKGDVNRDGKVNVSDVLYTMNKYMKGILTDEEKVIAEVTGDGKVNMNDVYRILAYAMGKISSL